jgi:hypothetical protein
MQVVHGDLIYLLVHVISQVQPTGHDLARLRDGLQSVRKFVLALQLVIDDLFQTDNRLYKHKITGKAAAH